MKLVDDKVSMILDAITTTTNESQGQVKQHVIEYFHQLKGLLQFLMNYILETRDPRTDLLQKLAEVSGDHKT